MQQTEWQSALTFRLTRVSKLILKKKMKKKTVESLEDCRNEWFQLLPTMAVYVIFLVVTPNQRMHVLVANIQRVVAS